MESIKSKFIRTAGGPKLIWVAKLVKTDWGTSKDSVVRPWTGHTEVGFIIYI